MDYSGIYDSAWLQPLLEAVGSIAGVLAAVFVFGRGARMLLDFIEVSDASSFDEGGFDPSSDVYTDSELSDGRMVVDGVPLTDDEIDEMWDGSEVVGGDIGSYETRLNDHMQETAAVWDDASEEELREKYGL